MAPPLLMEGRALRIGYALALAAVVGALAVPSAAVAAPPGGSLHLTTISVDEGFSESHHGFTFSELVYQGGKLVGRDRALCKFRGQFENIRCRITVTLPNGTLFLFARIGPDPHGSFTVTGGTGKYEGKTGVGIYRNVSDTASKVTIWLTS